MSKDIKKALEHCINNECVGCPNNEELGSGDIVCRARLLPDILEYIYDLQHRLKVVDIALEKACKRLQDYYCTTCDNQINCSRVEMCEMCLSTYLPSDFKEQAESELKGREDE